MEAELHLRAAVEEVARQRRGLPPGGEVGQDYVFHEMGPSGEPREVALSSLFGESDALILYNFMFGPDWDRPCPMCTSLIDGLDGNVQYLAGRASFVVVAKAPIERFAAWGQQRGWRRVRLLSSSGNRFNADYHAEFPSSYGDQHPVMHVFTRQDGLIRHFWSSEVLYTQTETDPRHVDSMWPLWNLLDLTPQGRGTEYPQFEE